MYWRGFERPDRNGIESGGGGEPLAPRRGRTRKLSRLGIPATAGILLLCGGCVGNSPGTAPIPWPAAFTCPQVLPSPGATGTVSSTFLVVPPTSGLPTGCVIPNTLGYAFLAPVNDNAGRTIRSAPDVWGNTVTFSPPMRVSGQTATQGLALIAATDTSSVPDPGNTDAVSYLFGGQAVSFSALVGIDAAELHPAPSSGLAPVNMEATFTADGVPVKTVTLSPGQAPVRVDIPLRGVNNFEIAASNLHGQGLGLPINAGQVDIVDISVDGSPAQASTTVPPGSAAICAQPSGLAAPVVQLCNIYGFLMHPVNPVNGNSLRGDPYSATSATVGQLLAGLNNPPTDSQLQAIQNADDVLRLLVPNVEGSAQQTPVDVAYSNYPSPYDGEFGIAALVSSIVAQRVGDGVIRLGNIAGDIASVGLGDFLDKSAVTFLTGHVQDFGHLASRVLAAEIHWGTNQYGPLVVENYVSDYASHLGVAADLQKAEFGFEQSLADILLASNAGELDHQLSQFVAEAEAAPGQLSTAGVAAGLADMSGPALIAEQTAAAFNAPFSSPWLTSLQNLLQVVPPVSDKIPVLSALPDFALAGADLGQALADINYLADWAFYVPLSSTTLDTLPHTWESASDSVLGQQAATPPTPATTITAVVPLTSGCVMTGTRTQCPAGALIGVTGRASGASGPATGQVINVTTTNSPSATVEAPAVITGPSGAYSDGVLLPDTVGQQVQVTASIPGTSISAAETVFVGAGAAVNITLVGPASIAPGTGLIQVEGIVTDHAGNGVPNIPVQLTSTAGKIEPSSVFTNASGTYQGTIPLSGPVASFVVAVQAKVPSGVITNSIRVGASG